MVLELGDVDIMVNNAGIDTTHELDGMSRCVHRMIDVHLRGTFLFTREVLPAMEEERRPHHQPFLATRPQGRADDGPLRGGEIGIKGAARFAYEVARDGDHGESQANPTRSTRRCFGVACCSTGLSARRASCRSAASAK